MGNPLSLWHFYFRNKRKVLPVIGILALAILGVVVTDSLLASARETAYATYGSYQKLILIAPRATRDQDLANPLQDSLAQLHEVQLQVDVLDGPGGLSSYYAAVTAIPGRVQAQLPAMRRLQTDAANARYYAARLRGDLVPLGDLIVRVQRLQSEERPSSSSCSSWPRIQTTRGRSSPISNSIRPCCERCCPTVPSSDGCRQRSPARHPTPPVCSNHCRR